MSSNLIATTWNREETQFHFTHRIPSPKLAQLSTKEAHPAHEFSHEREWSLDPTSLAFSIFTSGKVVVLTMVSAAPKT